MIDLFPNATFFVQLAIFFAVIAVLSRGIFKPIVALVDARQEKSSGSMEKVVRYEKIVEEKTAQYHGALQQARNEALTLKDKIRQEAGAEEKRIVEAARKDAEAALSKIRSELEADVVAAKEGLAREIPALASLIAKKIRNPGLMAFLFAFFTAMTASPVAMASADEGGHHAGPSLALLFQLINFALLLGALFFLLRKPAKAFFAARRASLEHAMTEASRARQAVEERARAIEARMAALDREIKSIKDDILSTAELEKKVIVERATALAARAKADIAVIADQELKKAREDLKRHAIDLALQAARDELSRSLDAGESRAQFDRQVTSGLRGVL